MWKAVLAKVEELTDAAKADGTYAGSGRSVAMLRSDGLGLMTVFRIYLSDGSTAVHLVSASSLGPRHGIAVDVSTSYSQDESRWEKTIADGDLPAVVIDNHTYTIHPDLPRGRSVGAGYGGRLFRIRFLDGRIVETRNLWSGATIPPKFRTQIPDTAEFLPTDVTPGR
jgi:hypothetical protein